ncbi:zinc-finger double domain-containing protein [Ditylenchus destructor]|uniref:Zinc-finger double domain-containing protein n=1 Tax=Ditylenchus destructor TaxID=166010 RepID=A0AAD4QZQ1_9BILA|nr:zinc-finger double domain-containing protein [Ditylenchus destructor]
MIISQNSVQPRIDIIEINDDDEHSQVKQECVQTFPNAVKPEIEIIEIDDDDEQAEEQELVQTPQDAALEVARSEIAQIHNAPAIDQTFPEAVPDPPHPLLPDTEPTLLPTFNQQSDLNQEPMEEPEIAPVIGFGDLTSINLYPDVMSSANGSESSTTDHFHGTSEEVQDSDVAHASMTAGEASDIGSTHLPNLNEVSTVEEPNASNGITPTATLMPVSTEIPPSKNAKGPNKQIGSRKSKPRIVPQEPDRDEDMPLNLRLRDRKKVHYAEFEDHGLRVETKRYRLSRAEQNSQILEDNSLASSIFDDPDQQQHGFGESRDESATEDDEESEYGLESETDGENLTSETRSEYDRFENETEETSTSKTRSRDSRKVNRLKCNKNRGQGSSMQIRAHAGGRRFKLESRDSRKVNCHKRNENRHQGGSMQMQRDRRFKCKKCSYVATYRSYLIRHERTHTSERPYKCRLCKYAAARSGDLITHMRIHTGEKPYKCRFCKFATALNSNLIIHTRTHTGEKPYKCRFCEYAATQRSHLISHIRVHTGEKPYKCRLCKYAAARSGDLITHMRIHTGEKPYKCRYCQHASNQSSILKRHMRTQHKDVLKLNSANSKKIPNASCSRNPKD